MEDNNYGNYSPDILECIANLSNDEVFTPPKLVNEILDLLPKHVWQEKNYKWLDPSCKTGVFLREIAKRLFIGLSNVIPDQNERKEHILKNMLYGIALTELTVLTSRRTVYCSKDASSLYSTIKFDNHEGNIFYENIQHIYKDKNGKNNNFCIKCNIDKETLEKKNKENSEHHAYQFIHEDIIKIIKGNTDMKFNVIVGNPPYQINDGGGGGSATPLYHQFINQAKSLNPDYLSMIIPARWYVGGKGLDDFRKEMLEDKKISYLVDHPDSGECFPGVEIKGGVCYFLRDNSHNGDCTVINKYRDYTNELKRSLKKDDVLVRFNEAVTIIEKVSNFKEDTLDHQISSRKPFGIATTEMQLTSKTKINNNIKIYIRGGIAYINPDLIKTGKENISKYKVLISKAYGAGEGFPHQILGEPIIADINTCCSETYLIAGAYDTLSEAENFSSYLKTKFFRFLVSQIKITQNITKDKFKFVPKLEMNIKWTDEILYEKYKLTQQEIDFINLIVKSYS